MKTAGARTPHDVDHASVLIVPQGIEHDDEGLTAIFETLALFPSVSLLDRVAEDEGIAASQVRRFFDRCRIVPRSRWLEQLLQEYFFARVVSRRESAQTRAFFERQILVELLACGLGRRKRAEPDRAAIAGETVTGRALRYIESNLFSQLPVAAIAGHAFACLSTLLRQFRRDTGTTPHAYIKTRRLEEA